MAVLEVKNLSKNFDGVAAVDNVSLKFTPGMITGIIGPNGSGKTTLTNLLSGVLVANAGSVAINGLFFENAPAYVVALNGVTRTFQDVRLFNQMTVMDNLLLTLTERPVFKALFGTHSQGQLENAENILKKVGLLEKKQKLASSLSYGQRKLLEIARVIAMDSEIVLFDEPFAGLFPEIIKIVVEVINEMKEQNKTIVLIEHNMELIRKLSDYLYVMDAGKVLAEGKPAEVLAKRDVIEAYLGE